MTYIRWFQDIRADEIELVGGKGANLGEMASAGLPVPPGFCLTAPAYRQLIEVTGLYSVIEEILAEMDAADPADVDAKSGRIRELIAQQPIPNGMGGEILEAYRQLCSMVRPGSVKPVPVAIRSSATAEDLPTASFAGQQDTYLNIRGQDALLDAIRRCWASLWTTRAVTYRTKQGFDHQKVYVSVVVQAMIESEVSGILFTANPVNGDPDQVVINASWGLGEAIVSGQVSPDTLTLRKRDGFVLDRQTADKDLMITYAPGGGTIELEPPAEWRKRPALTDTEAAELAALAHKIETHYGTPQDIEWAYARDKWYVLQARPITTLKQPEKVFDVPGEYNRTMMVEIFPDALSPSFLSVVVPLLHGMFDFTFQTLGFKPPEGLDAVRAFYNQPYFHRDYIAAALNRLAPSVREPMVDQIVNPFGREEHSTSGDLSPAYLGMAARMMRFMVRFPKQLPDILAEYRAEVEKVGVYDMSQASDADIVDQIRYLVFDCVSGLLNYDFLMIALIGRTYRMLGSILRRYYGPETDEVVTKLISGVTGNVTMETNKRLWELARQAGKSPATAETLRNGTPDQLRDELQRTPEGQTFLAALDQFLGEYGHREIRMDILYPTWGEDPVPVFGFLRSYLDADESQSPHAQEARLVAEREELTAAAMARVRQSVSGRLVAAPLFNWILQQSQIHTRERDTMHFEWTRLFPPFRRLLLELGRRWQERDLIARQDDIFFLHFEEMEAIAVAPRPYHEVAQQRRDEWQTNCGRSWPDIIRNGREIYLSEAVAPESAGDGVKGIAGSSGVVTGVCKVIRGPEDFHKLQKGEILVAPLTNPVWTPLFAVAGGVVTEVGGILSHGAIVAREYGIPAVMSVPGATRHFSEGQTITVDGNLGVVYAGEGAMV